MKQRDKDENKIYSCSLHKQYATYTTEEAYLTHLEMEHGVDRKDLRLLKEYTKKNGKWIDK